MSVTDKPYNELIFSIGGGKIGIVFYLGRKRKRFRYPLRYTSKESSGRINAPHGTKPLYMRKAADNICPLPHPAKSLSPSFYVTQCKNTDFYQ